MGLKESNQSKWYAYWVSSDSSTALSIFRSVIDEKYLSIDGIEPGSIIEVSVIPYELRHEISNNLTFWQV